MWTSFIGFMGSGKTTITRRLQALTNRPAASTDDLVVEKAGRPIARIFADDGEAAFRALELKALSGLDGARPLLVDTGGGIVGTPDAVDLLRQRGVVIWIDEPWADIRTRLKASDAGRRPLVQTLGWDGLEDLFRRRRSLYAAAADFRLTPRGGDLDALARRAMMRSLIWERRQEGTRG